MHSTDFHQRANWPCPVSLCNWVCPFKFQLIFLWTNQTWLNMELSALPVIPWKGQLFHKPFEKAGVWPPDHVPVAACVSAGLCCSLHTKGPFSVSSFLRNSGALSRATCLVNISLATVVLSQQRRLSAQDILAPAASAQGLLCERGLSRPLWPRAPHHKPQAWVFPILLGLSHPSEPFSSDRNVRTQLDAFSGAVSNIGLTCSP